MNENNSIFLQDNNNQWGGYKNIRDEEYYSEVRLCLEEMWKQYCPYADKQFKKELQKSEVTFNQRIWEMYLTYSLLKAKHRIIEKNLNSGPDVCIKYVNKKIWIEAVCPESGIDQKNSVPIINCDPSTNLESFNITAYTSSDSERQIKLRYLNSIDYKYKKILNYIEQKTIDCTDPIIIALNSANFQQENDLKLDMPIIYGLCYGLNPNLACNLKGDQRIMKYEPEEEIYKYKDNNLYEIVNSAIFKRNFYPHISAILFSYFRLSRSSKSNFILIHNPFAINPIRKKYIKITSKEY